MIFLLDYADTYMPLLTTIVFLLLWKYIDKQERIIFCYAIFSVLLFSATNVMGRNKINNLFLYHIFTLVELILITHYILKLILKKPFSLQYFILTGVYTIVWIGNIVFFEPLNFFNSQSGGVSNLTILFLSMYYFLNLSKSDKILHFQTLPEFWIVSAFLIYCSLSLLVYISYKYYVITNQQAEGIKIWYIISIATIIKFVFIIAGIICYKRNNTSQRIL